MIRKLALAALAAAASLGAATLAPSAASAGGISISFGHGWHGGYGYHGYYRPALVVGGFGDVCMQKRVVETRRGLRVRWVNTCVY